MLTAQRTVSHKPRYKSGTFYSEKCRREIQYESGIELEFIKQLERADNVLFYCEQPIKIPYTRGKIRQSTTPDFAVLLKNFTVVIVEIKPLAGMFENKVQMKVEGLIRYCHRKLEKEILNILENRIIRKKECNELLKKHGANQNDLLKIVLRNQLKYKSFPFRLQSGNKNDLFYQVFCRNKRYDDIWQEQISSFFKI